MYEQYIPLAVEFPGVRYGFFHAVVLFHLAST